jgi:GntR family transcriptional regulator
VSYVTYGTIVIPFDIELKLGKPAYKQLVYAAHKAFVTGQLKQGDRFPSVRAISKELKLNPNTVLKAVSLLIQQGLLVSEPGIGTVVNKDYEPDPRQKSELFDELIEPLIIEAKKHGIKRAEFLEVIKERWEQL